MYEYHGWATLRETYLNEDIVEEKFEEMVADIKAKIIETGADNGLLDLRAVNGEYQLHLSGLLNHKGRRAEEIFQLYEFIAKTAKGSYGLLYILDDEDENGKDNEFQVYIMARGKVIMRADPFLSPLIPTVENSAE